MREAQKVCELEKRHCDTMEWEKFDKVDQNKCAKCIAQMKFVSFGFELCHPQRGDRCAFAIKYKSRSFKIQLRSLRRFDYACISRENFNINNEYLFLVFVAFNNNEVPNIFLIQATEWRTPNNLLKIGVYPNALPDYGIRYSQKNLNLLSEYKFENKIKDLLD